MRGRDGGNCTRQAHSIFLVALALSFLGIFVPASATSIVAPGSLGAAIFISHVPVSAAGGGVLIHINVFGASSCRVAITPQIRLRSIGASCHNLDNTYLATVGMNPELHERRFVLTLDAERNRQLVVRHLVITQAKAPNRVDNFTLVSSYGVYGNGQNDAVGDCTLATAADLLQTWDALQGLANGPLDAQPFLNAYHTLVGGPGGPNVGLTARQVLNYWQRTGIDNNRITSWHSVDAYRNPALIEAAISRNGALYASVALPSSDSNFLPIWSMVEAPYGTPVAGGHALAIVGYDARGPYFATWGGIQHATWQWWKTWGTGAYVIKPSTAQWIPNVVSVTPNPLG